MTPLIQLDQFYLKREDLNPTGSAKDRALIYQVSHLISQGYSGAVIASTGNAAISASYFCQHFGIKLTVFVSPKIHPHKLKLLQSLPLKLITSSTANSDAFKYAKDHHVYFLRQSTDTQALVGYRQLGQEIQNQLPQLTSIFVPVASGTTLLGISQALPPTVKIFAVQPASCAPISRVFQPQAPLENSTITDALGVRLLPLKPQIIHTLNQSQGSGLVVPNSQVIKYHQYLHQHQVNCSPEGGLALAGWHQAKNLGLNLGKYPLILITGTQR
jgi:threonine dehydratase